MDDLLGEDWQAPPKPAFTTTSQPSASTFASNYSSFRASPQPPSSGIASPQNLSRPSSTVNGTKSSANDSFSNLLGTKSQKPTANLSIQERQKQLLQEKLKQQEQQSHIWETLSSGRGTPEVRHASPAPAAGIEEDDDILAAFNKAAPVDNASYYPPPASGAVSGRSTPVVGHNGRDTSTDVGGFDEDDDPFGLGAAPKKSNGHAVAHSAAGVDNDDILGDLSKPVQERKAPGPMSKVAPEPLDEDEEDNDDDDGPVSADVRPPKGRGHNPALAELVEMGFPPDTAQIALAENGGNVQAAVGWLLQQAHEESRQKAKGQSESRQRSAHADSRSPARRRPTDQESVPAWMRQEARAGSATRKQDNESSVNGEKDAGQVASEFGTKFLKSANSLWKASQKQMAKTMAEFQQERDPSQPKWLQEGSADSSRASSQRRPEIKAAPKPAKDLTDEAAMLDAPRSDRPSKPPRPAAVERVSELPARGRSPVEPLPYRPSAQPKSVQQAPQKQEQRPAAKLSRQQVEDQTAQAYVSPARRKRPTPKPEPPPEPEIDLFGSGPAQPAASSAAAPLPMKTVQAPAASRSLPASSKAKAPPRAIPGVSPSALSTSAQHRKTGGEAFKRGDYAAAHEHYTSALSPLPPTHPITIILLSNRSLTALKTGDAKTAVSDADRALDLIGPSQGASESIDLGAGEGVKEMREFYGKALMRKAEALEHMEKWTDAAAAWRQAVEAGVGGSVSLKGRDRCEKAASPRPAQSVTATPVRSKVPAPGRAPPAKGMGNSLQRPTLTSAGSAEAVKKLRAANAAAEKADDERFALTDQVDARLTAWKGSKADNLRALLQSLDAVLWEGAGWKKVGMSDLVIPGKVKVIYMKAIAKVHPDKIPQDATTEQRMVSAAVFSTLNEAWDKFKADNNL